MQHLLATVDGLEGGIKEEIKKEIQEEIQKLPAIIKANDLVACQTVFAAIVDLVDLDHIAILIPPVVFFLFTLDVPSVLAADVSVSALAMLPAEMKDCVTVHMARFVCDQDSRTRLEEAQDSLIGAEALLVAAIRTAPVDFAVFLAKILSSVIRLDANPQHLAYTVFLAAKLGHSNSILLSSLLVSSYSWSTVAVEVVGKIKETMLLRFGSSTVLQDEKRVVAVHDDAVSSLEKGSMLDASTETKLFLVSPHNDQTISISLEPGQLEEFRAGRISKRAKTHDLFVDVFRKTKDFDRVFPVWTQLSGATVPEVQALERFLEDWMLEALSNRPEGLAVASEIIQRVGSLVSFIEDQSQLAIQRLYSVACTITYSLLTSPTGLADSSSLDGCIRTVVEVATRSKSLDVIKGIQVARAAFKVDPTRRHVYCHNWHIAIKHGLAAKTVPAATAIFSLVRDYVRADVPTWDEELSMLASEFSMATDVFESICSSELEMLRKLRTDKALPRSLKRSHEHVGIDESGLHVLGTVVPFSALVSVSAQGSATDAGLVHYRTGEGAHQSSFDVSEGAADIRAYLPEPAPARILKTTVARAVVPRSPFPPSGSRPVRASSETPPLSPEPVTRGSRRPRSSTPVQAVNDDAVDPRPSAPSTLSPREAVPAAWNAGATHEPPAVSRQDVVKMLARIKHRGGWKAEIDTLFVGGWLVVNEDVYVATVVSCRVGRAEKNADIKSLERACQTSALGNGASPCVQVAVFLWLDHLHAQLKDLDRQSIRKVVESLRKRYQGRVTKLESKR